MYSISITVWLCQQESVPHSRWKRPSVHDNDFVPAQVKIHKLSSNDSQWMKACAT